MDQSSVPFCWQQASMFDTPDLHSFAALGVAMGLLPGTMDTSTMKSLQISSSSSSSFLPPTMPMAATVTTASSLTLPTSLVHDNTTQPSAKIPRSIVIPTAPLSTCVASISTKLVPLPMLPAPSDLCTVSDQTMQTDDHTVTQECTSHSGSMSLVPNGPFVLLAQKRRSSISSFRLSSETLPLKVMTPSDTDISQSQGQTDSKNHKTDMPSDTLPTSRSQLSLNVNTNHQSCPRQRTHDDKDIKDGQRASKNNPTRTSERLERQEPTHELSVLDTITKNTNTTTINESSPRTHSSSALFKAVTRHMSTTKSIRIASPPPPSPPLSLLPLEKTTHETTAQLPCPPFRENRLSLSSPRVKKMSITQLRKQGMSARRTSGKTTLMLPMVSSLDKMAAVLRQTGEGDFIVKRRVTKPWLCKGCIDGRARRFSSAETAAFHLFTHHSASHVLTTSLQKMRGVMPLPCIVCDNDLRYDIEQFFTHMHSKHGMPRVVCQPV